MSWATCSEHLLNHETSEQQWWCRCEQIRCGLLAETVHLNVWLGSIITHHIFTYLILSYAADADHLLTPTSPLIYPTPNIYVTSFLPERPIFCSQSHSLLVTVNWHITAKHVCSLNLLAPTPTNAVLWTLRRTHTHRKWLKIHVCREKWRSAAAFGDSGGFWERRGGCATSSHKTCCEHAH